MKYECYICHTEYDSTLEELDCECAHRLSALQTHLDNGSLYIGAKNGAPFDPNSGWMTPQDIRYVKWESAQAIEDFAEWYVFACPHYSNSLFKYTNSTSDCICYINSVNVWAQMSTIKSLVTMFGA